MKYCGNTECRQPVWSTTDSAFCQECGGELTPCIKCLCGKTEVNPRNPNSIEHPNFCSSCGARFTEEYLGRCMNAQLGGMVQEIRNGQFDLGALARQH